MKRRILKLYSILCLPLKIIFVIWLIFSLSSLVELNFLEWFIVFLFGTALFVFLPQLLINLYRRYKKEKIRKNTMKNLFYYKSNFNKLDKVELSFYKNTLELMLNQVKLDASFVNTTSDLKTFVEHWDSLIKTLIVLSEHEYTGFFSRTSPSNNLRIIMKNKPLTEVKFIKRAFSKDKSGGYRVPDKDIKFLSFFSKGGIEFINTGIEPIIPNEKELNIGASKFDYMEGHDFEYFCADLLRKNGFINVEVTKGSGDQGIDIIAYKDDIKYGIQCKCYSSDINNKAVQEAFAGKTFYNCHVAVVLTNRHFTSSAKELAQRNGVLLWDREKLVELINNSQ